MRYALLASTTLLALLTALPASAGGLVRVDPYSQQYRGVIVERCYQSRFSRGPEYEIYNCRTVINDYRSRRRYRVYRPYRDRYYIYDRYRYRRPGVQIQIGY